MKYGLALRLSCCLLLMFFTLLCDFKCFILFLFFSDQYMLRQGKPAVQALHEVEVLTTDYVGEDIPLPSTSVGHKSASSPVTVHTIIRGRLHVRTGNIGE